MFLVILDEEIVAHSCYVKNVFSAALTYENEVLGEKWTFQQDGTNPHPHHLTRERCRDNFLSFINKERCPPNSPDLNPLDDSIWDKLINIIDWSKVRPKMNDTD